jgi:WD40 repeat protein/tRNA A-37 threonylcarbamoyl transferase component Bud32
MFRRSDVKRDTGYRVRCVIINSLVSNSNLLAGKEIMPRLSCLTPEELKAFNLGDFPEAVLEELAAHLEKCPRCEAAARSLDAVSDPVVEAYRESALVAPLAEPAAPPERVGGYEILEELGRGGMGVVYKARHLKLQRLVALKMLLGGSFVTSEERARFRIEAEAVARLRHPNIVQIYEIGEHEVDAGLPRPYFTLEFAAGGNLSSRMAGRPQAPRQAAAWLETMARAAHYAHQQGIIHRDLKPSNVLLTEAGEPMLCDFGVAKLMTGSDVKTKSGTLLGTAEYMAPEQATEGEKAGPAADTYALGAILYTMLTGRPPFQGSNTLHILEQVRSQEPVPLRRLVPHLPRDLETICLKCLEKEPSHRYASAADLADDLQRFLLGETIQARPAPVWERGWKWSKRRPVVAGLLAAVIALGLLGVALMFGLWRGAEARVKAEMKAKDLAREKEQEEVRGRQEGLRLLANVTLDHGLNLCARGETNHGLLLLARALRLAEEAGAHELGHVARVNLAVWRRRLVTPRASLHHDGWVWAVTFSPDGRTALTGGTDNVARRWDTRTGRQIGEPLRHSHPVWAVSFSPDGRTILTGSGDDQKHEGEARLWNAATGEPLGPPLPHSDEVYGATFSPDGQRFLTVCDEEVRIWRLEKSSAISRLLPHPRPARRIEGIHPRLWAVFSPDGRLVLTGGEDGTARLWDPVTGAARGEPLRHEGPVLSMAFSPDGKTLVTGSYDCTARMWDAATCRQRGPDLLHQGRVLAVDVRFDGQFVVTGSAVEDRDLRTDKRQEIAGEVRMWHAPTGKLFGEPMRHSQKVFAVAFRPRGGKLLVGGKDRAARFYSIIDGAILGKPLDHEGTVANVVFSPRGRLALTASAGGDHSANARLWEVAPGDPVTWSTVAIHDEGKQMRFGSFSPDGRNSLCFAGNRVREYDIVTGAPAGPVLTQRDPARNAYYSPNGRYFLTVGDQYSLRFWERASGRQIAEGPSGAEIASHDFSADGEYVAIVRKDRSVEAYQISTGEPQGPIWKLPPQCSHLILGRDGRIAYSHDASSSVQEWDVAAGKIRQVWNAPGRVKYLLLVAGNVVVITGEGAHLERAWDLESGQPMSGPLADLAGNISQLAFSPDGRSILTGLWDRHNARLWDAATGKPIGPPVNHGEAVHMVAFTPDGKRMMSLSVNGEYRAQDVPSSLNGDAERIRCWVELLTGMELDAQGVIHDLDPEALQERRERLRELGGPPDGVRLQGERINNPLKNKDLRKTASKTTINLDAIR